MSIACQKIMELMEDWAPENLAEDWDNPGLCIGSPQEAVSKVLVALDDTEDVIDEAIRQKANLIVTHHPFLFRGIKKIREDQPTGRKIYKLIDNNIGVFSAHTNLDVAEGGTNDCLARLIGLCEIKALEEGIGRIGVLEQETSFIEFANLVKRKLFLDSMRIVGKGDCFVKRVALCTGAGIEFLDKEKKEGADVYITSDFKYHEAQAAEEKNICLIDATHYASEVLIVPEISSYLKKNLQDACEVLISSVNGQPFSNI